VAARQQRTPQVGSSAPPHPVAQQAQPRLQHQVRQPRQPPLLLAHPYHQLNLVSQVKPWTRF
jgi:hypothetical protein